MDWTALLNNQYNYDGNAAVNKETIRGPYFESWSAVKTLILEKKDALLDTILNSHIKGLG